MSDRRRERPLVNHELFTQLGADSGSLTMLAAAAHRFPEPGEYVGVVTRGKEEVGSFRIRSDESSPAMQVNVDLAGLGPEPRRGEDDCDCGPEHAGSPFVVNPSGYALFHVSRGAGGYRVRVGKLGAKREAAFDSARLAGEDLFMLTLVRPGTYVMRNAIAKTRGEIVVPYPKPTKKPRREQAPVEIGCTEEAFRPAQAKVQSAQGVVWRFSAPGHIQVELVKPDDGPKRRYPVA